MSDWSRVNFFLKLLRLSRSESGGTATKLGFEVVKDSSIIDREALPKVSYPNVRLENLIKNMNSLTNGSIFGRSRDIVASS